MGRRGKHKQAGLTLVESMVAMTVAAIAVLAIITLFVNTKETYLLTENMARLQENGRFAMHLLSRDLRLTDYRACNTFQLLKDQTPPALGQNDTSTYDTEYPADTVSTVYQVLQPEEVSDVYDLADPDTVDCSGAPQPMQVTRTWYIKKPDGRDQPSLFRLSNNGTTTVDEELVEGIENLQVLYGQDTNDDFVPDFYADATSITNWGQVIAARFTVTARTASPFGANDNQRISRDFTSTVVLRNRMP